MNWLLDLTGHVGRSLYPYLGDIAIALLACVLVVLSPDIQLFIRRRIITWPFLARTLVFVLLVAFGYGMVITQAAPYLASQLAQLSPQWLLLVVCLSFTLIGLWAERHRQM
ncbi:DUF3392 domain-containing protein [Ferrimonas marina]|uniref:DUF3392 domain-containing protein n=1 Tax=Ferrimonas marina TaxID=299255 RepID=A0A1M5XBU5_9GAMM|nr:DUF3392 domain-containing protein [Ferrimonas marina]SHH96663.1 Protein of unknown function [Ferrimonas marina]